MSASLAAFVLVVVLSFAGGWVWRGAFDMWRRPKARVYGMTSFTSSMASVTEAAQAMTALVEGQSEKSKRRLRAVE